MTEPIVTGRVRCYWNSHQQLWSVQQNRRVVAHCTSLALKDIKPIISLAGQARVRREGKKDVHAYLEGEIVSMVSNPNSPFVIEYNPYEDSSFKLRLRTGGKKASRFTLDLTEKNSHTIKSAVLSGSLEKIADSYHRSPLVQAYVDIESWATLYASPTVAYKQLLEFLLYGE